MNEGLINYNPRLWAGSEAGLGFGREESSGVAEMRGRAACSGKVNRWLFTPS